MNATTSRRRKTATAAPTPGLPTAKQMIALALAQAESNVLELITTRIRDEHWAEQDIDVDNSTELLLGHLRQMKEQNFSSYEEFYSGWYLATAVVNLAQKGFSRTDCSYARRLDSARKFFEMMAESVEFVGLREQQA